MQVATFMPQMPITLISFRTSRAGYTKYRKPSTSNSDILALMLKISPIKLAAGYMFCFF